MSGGDPHGFDPWVDAQGNGRLTSLVPRPRSPLEDEFGIRFLGPPVHVRRGPRRGLVLAMAFLVAVSAMIIGRWWAIGHDSVPPAGYEEAATPLGSPSYETLAATGNHAFAAMQPDGSGPVAWSPCRPIHFVVRQDGAPPNGDQLVTTAIARISAATGLVFVDDGATQEAPSTDRAAYQPDLYGKRWAPVLVAWSTPEETPELAGDTIGIGGSAPVTQTGQSVYVTGSVTLDAPGMSELLATPNGVNSTIGVITHEFAHVVGLDHVDDPTQLMNPRASAAISTLQQGDLAGLAVLSLGACAPHL
ncbi:matrixin family metalloprotease [Cellulomonas sp. URHE0023]|uniref:matrixin family metalloprotease n=1 Tax=Cellulomonas sp. URHE0023 TaxID=1380354 RepID=UPI00068EE4FE|nr:matrixin family metalloprotease [Cellulomonas sp. URHE0023]